MQHRRLTFALALVAACLSAAPRPVCAQTSPQTSSKKQIDPVMLEAARKKFYLEEQLAEARLYYTDVNPRVVVLREQVASFNPVVTPQAMLQAISERLSDLQSQQTSLQSDYFQKQLMYTNQSAQLRNARQRLDDISERILALQQQKRAIRRAR